MRTRTKWVVLLHLAKCYTELTSGWACSTLYVVRGKVEKKCDLIADNMTFNTKNEELTRTCIIIRNFICLFFMHHMHRKYTDSKSFTYSNAIHGLD